MTNEVIIKYSEKFLICLIVSVNLRRELIKAKLDAKFPSLLD